MTSVFGRVETDEGDQIDTGSGQESIAHEESSAHGDHPPELAHHYANLPQQFHAAKLGMWLFLATEVLLFGGLFCLYAILRSRQPELFAYGSQFLDTRMGAINTVVLILSSMTIAFGVRYAQLGRRGPLVAMLVLTLLGGAIFMGIKYVEYADKFDKGLFWGVAFYEDRTVIDDAEVIEVVEEPAVKVGDAARGRTLWMNTCLACHGDRGQGVTGQAYDIRDREFVIDQSDDELIAFIARGRMPFDPANTTGIQMPPKGGNPMLTNDDLRDIVAFIRTLQIDPDADPADADETDISDNEEMEIFIPKSSIPLAPRGPAGLRMDRLDGQPDPQPEKYPDPRTDPDRPPNAHLFFGLYFMMTGLHGIHVLIGMAFIAWLIVCAAGGRFTPRYYTPVDLGGLYWHVVDLIWIFLFPLFYLII